VVHLLHEDDPLQYGVVVVVAMEGSREGPLPVVLHVVLLIDVVRRPIEDAPRLVTDRIQGPVQGPLENVVIRHRAPDLEVPLPNEAEDLAFQDHVASPIVGRQDNDCRRSALADDPLNHVLD
jgi:hypothetical protein